MLMDLSLIMAKSIRNYKYYFIYNFIKLKYVFLILEVEIKMSKCYKDDNQEKMSEIYKKSMVWR